MKVGEMEKNTPNRLEYSHLMAYKRIENMRKRKKEKQQNVERKIKQRKKSSKKRKMKK